jgi:hypothetical protein
MNLDEAVKRRRSRSALFAECFGSLSPANLRVWTALAEATEAGASSEQLELMVRDSGLSEEEAAHLSECTRKYMKEGETL